MGATDKKNIPAGASSSVPMNPPASKPVNPVQQAVADLAARGATVTDPATGKIHPVQHIAEGTKKGPGPVPLTQEEKDLRKKQREEEAALRKDLLTKAHAAVASGDATAGAEMLEKLTALFEKDTNKKADAEKLLTKIKAKTAIREKYQQLGGDNWLMGLLKS